MYEVISLEKRMTAFVIPNAIQLSTRTAKYTFTSFLSRDTTFDVLYNVWRLARPEDSYDMGASSQRVSLDEGEGDAAAADGTAVNGAGAVAKKAAAKAKVTQCECGRAGKHYTETAMDAIFPGTPEKIYNLMFTSGFMKDFMRENQKLIGAYPPPHTHAHTHTLVCTRIWGTICEVTARCRHPDLGLDPDGEPEAARAQHDVHQAAEREHRAQADALRAARRDDFDRL